MAVINVILDATIQARCVHAQVTTGSRHRGHPQSPIAKVKGKTHSPNRELSMVHSSFPHCSVSLGRLSASGAALTLTGITAAHAGMPRVWIQVFAIVCASCGRNAVCLARGGNCGTLFHHHHDGLEILVHGSIARCNQLGQIGWHQGCSHSLHLGAQGAHELSLRAGPRRRRIGAWGCRCTGCSKACFRAGAGRGSKHRCRVHVFIRAVLGPLIGARVAASRHGHRTKSHSGKPEEKMRLEPKKPEDETLVTLLLSG